MSTRSTSPRIHVQRKSKPESFPHYFSRHALRFTLRNNREEVKDISSFGWRKVLDCAGSRHITIKINGILDSVLADELLRNSAILNSNNDYEINFNTKEKIRLRCSVELYERYYDPAAFDSFTVVLASAEVVNAFH